MYVKVNVTHPHVCRKMYVKVSVTHPHVCRINVCQKQCYTATCTPKKYRSKAMLYIDMYAEKCMSKANVIQQHVRQNLYNKSNVIQPHVRRKHVGQKQCYTATCAPTVVGQNHCYTNMSKRSDFIHLYWQYLIIASWCLLRTLVIIDLYLHVLS